MNKYGNHKTTIDGITFDSKHEAERYCELKMLERGKQIYDLKLQPRFEIQPSYKKNGKTVRAVEYVADFSYYDKTGRFIVEDAKGMKTDVYRLKKKLIEFRYDFTIEEV